MKQNFRLTQLYNRANPTNIMGTCHIHNNEDDNRFECTIKGDKNLKNQLWQFCEGSWNGNTGILCEVEFTDVNSRGLPTDGKIISVDGFNAILA